MADGDLIGPFAIYCRDPLAEQLAVDLAGGNFDPTAAANALHFTRVGDHAHVKGIAVLSEPDRRPDALTVLAKGFEVEILMLCQRVKWFHDLRLHSSDSFDPPGVKRFEQRAVVAHFSLVKLEQTPYPALAVISYAFANPGINSSPIIFPI